MPGNKGIKYLGRTWDITFSWVTKINPDLEQWCVLAAKWLSTEKMGKDEKIKALGKFLFNYIHKNGLSTEPSEFLRRDYSTPSFYNTCLTNMTSKHHTLKYLNYIHNFLNWVLENYFSVEDDDGNKFVPSEYHNPFKVEIPDGMTLRGDLDESDKSILAFRFIKQLRNMLCPDTATSFSDWKWAQSAMDSNQRCDWFVVDQLVINENDPDCVWRERETSKYEQETKGLPEKVYEIWSPVRTVGLLVKLLLPLRTYQVRMLDSGEADTFRYVQPQRHTAGSWIENPGLLKEGTEKHPIKRGVFRHFVDPVTRIEMTGFFINTNKTADIGKEELAKGYAIPWQFEEALYWLAKLRDWQEKYNPIQTPTPWTQLESKHLKAFKDPSILKSMGSTCFLFRNAVRKDKDKTKPIQHNGFEFLWYKLLLELQGKCEAFGKTPQDNDRLKFVTNNYPTTYYPLHSLRVSLITAYALEGGVPMPILSKCIAGHARLIMTLYYTKMGITYVSEKMSEAEQRMAEDDQASYLRWLRDAAYKQLDANTAFNDPAAIQAVLNAQQSGASFIKDDKGICPKAALGCDSGGVYVNDDTGKTSYGVVPGYPQQNCVRCRWFLTGPAFLPGLVHHFNVIGYEMGETAERMMRFEGEIEALDNRRYECEQNQRPFLEDEKLSKLHKLHQQEMEKNDKLANDLNATLRLIDRCAKITKRQPTDDDPIQLVAVGSIDDVQFALADVPSKLQQIQTICNGAVIFPETDASKAVLQRSQILDLTLAMNGHPPVFFKLSPEDQLVAGNAWMQLLIARTGSLDKAITYAEGRKKLSEIGLEDETTELLENMTGQTLRLGCTTNQATTKLVAASNERGRQ